ncbi:MAG: hypothetical protein R3F44_19725 [Candidatus Competibacteraceae bacterium]
MSSKACVAALGHGRQFIARRLPQREEFDARPVTGDQNRRKGRTAVRLVIVTAYIGLPWRAMLA